MIEEKERILVVDDELGMREGCCRVLSSAGYDVETAADGLEGFELFKKRQNFAAAIIDIKMPKMDGIELIKRIHELNEDVTLLVITAYSTIGSAVEATKRGAYGYIPKPFTPDELLLPVKKGLQKRTLTLESRRLREEREKRLLEIDSERSRCNTIIRCMTDGVVVVNLDKQVVLHNAAAVRIMPEFNALPLPAPVRSIQCSELHELIVEVLNTDGAPDIISQEIAKDECTYMVNVSPVVEKTGEISGAIAVLRDITKLKKLENAKSMFVSMVAHEIKGPLAAAESYLNVILSDMVSSDPERTRSMLQRSLVRIRTLRELVKELMNITAMETGHFTIKRAPIPLMEIVQAAMDSCREKAEEKEITLTLKQNGPCDMQRVLADKDAVILVLANLLDNAIKYTPKKGHTEVTVDRNGIYATVKVQDDGIGMTAQEMEKVFDEFYRAKNKYTDSIPGTGLGLSLVKRLVELHQGSVDVESAPDTGSTFTINIPIAE